MRFEESLLLHKQQTEQESREGEAQRRLEKVGDAVRGHYEALTRYRDPIAESAARVSALYRTVLAAAGSVEVSGQASSVSAAEADEGASEASFGMRDTESVSSTTHVKSACTQTPFYWKPIGTYSDSAIVAPVLPRQQPIRLTDEATAQTNTMSRGRREIVVRHVSEETNVNPTTFRIYRKLRFT